ncbi:TRAP transporter small permease [Bacillus sp. FJAT-45350]|uniref:TRAP transporter small permease n=1 Tax=Bacillus sp. FJAT-45350 TaxID=2011014 RepID=UPI0015CD5809|nr:TRAP transporter small permease [Bacillus sp. FJAT-45350]
MSKLLTYFEYSLVIFSLSVMSILTFANVISRYFINYSLSFTEEVTVNLFVLLIFTGAAIGIHRKSHLGFSLIYDLAKDSIKVILVSITGIISILIFSMVVYYTWDTIQFQMSLNQKSPALGWPQWIFSSGMLVGGALCLIRSIQVTVAEILTIVREGRKTT